MTPLSQLQKEVQDLYDMFVDTKYFKLRIVPRETIIQPIDEYVREKCPHLKNVILITLLI